MSAITIGSSKIESSITSNFQSIVNVRLNSYASIVDQLIGNKPLNSEIITDSDKFDELYRIRHNLIHAIICDVRGFPYGERKVSDILSDFKITDKRFYDEVKNQTPDFLDVRGTTGHMIEISVSRSPTMKQEKSSKYSLLLYFLRLNGINVRSEYIIINPDSVYRSRDELINIHKLNDAAIDTIKDICDRARILESEVRNTEMGKNYILQKQNIMMDDEDIPVTFEDVTELYESLGNKPFHSFADFKSACLNTSSDETDEDFISYCVSQVPKIKSKLTQVEVFDEKAIIDYVNNESKRLNGKLQTNYRSIFPLPYIQMKSTDAMKRSTETDYLLTTKIAGRMISSDDVVLGAFGSGFQKTHKKEPDNSAFPFEVHFTAQMKEFIALEGPNRKKYVKRPDLYPEHVRKQKEYSMYSLAYDVDVRELGALSFWLSKVDKTVETSDIYDDTKILSRLTGPGLEYVKCCQSVFREININSLRNDRRRKHILKPTGIDGLYVLIFKGPKLRTGEIPSQIWFKVIIDNEYASSLIPPNPRWAFKRLINAKTVSHSPWLSTDAHRLDHYLRCYDKILMAYYSFRLMRYRTTYNATDETDLETSNMANGSLIKSINSDNSDTLGIIIMTYMEDRRSTSKLLQNVRYLVMSMISIYKSPNSVFQKCLEPVRSPLQLYFLKSMMQFTKTMIKTDLSKVFSYGSVRYDPTTQTFIDHLGGARLMLPRPIVTDRDGVFADFAEILSEMYLSMLFNKNQDNPTHSSFQILSKMLEGEESMQEVKSQGNHLGYKPEQTDIEWANHVINEPHSHQFSAKAIEVGARLIRKGVNDNQYLDITIARRKKNVNKSLDEFATYKSSAKNLRDTYDSSVTRQNQRRRCLEGVVELVENKELRSFDVIKNHFDHPVEFQIFKKNQIGGVREILILTMISRIKINVIETISRNICMFDKREILTHGGKKNDFVKEALYSAKRLPGKRMSLFLSFDKSKWGPSFVPIQFLYLFSPFKKQLGNMYLYILSQLMLHQNKKCILPERLVMAWNMDSGNLLSHRKDERLQKLKEEFLKTKKLFFVNESNMGQGILHYTSSYLHAAMISFRDELYKRSCERFKMDHKDHYDLFSSDDSFTVLSMEIKKMAMMIKKIDIFMRCQEISERLFNCTTSRSKSSINPMIGEFNSLFMSNMTFFPTLIKFAVAAVHPTNTDSFFRMTKESYAASRQIVENGGTLDLYLVSQYMNKDFCESMYHTYPGGANDLSLRGIHKYPYQLGHFPIFNPSLMLMFGPEYHNYYLYKTMDTMNDDEKTLFSNSHKIIKGGVVETLSELEEGETMLGGLLRIEARIGPVQQHQRLMRLVEEKMMSRGEMEKLIVDNPLIMFDDEVTDQNIRFKISHKLMVPGAKEAVKTITSSIYFGRMSATVSANAFYIPNHEMESKTYGECIDQLIHKESKSINIQDNIQFLYPKWPEYELFLGEIYNPVPTRFRHIMDTQTIRTLSVFKIGTSLNNSIYSVIKYLWISKDVPEHERSRLNRDVSTLKSFYPMIKDTLQETKDQFSGDDLDKTKAIIMLLLKLYTLKDRSIKAIIFGPSTSDLRETYYVLTEKNSSIPMQHLVKHSSIEHKELSWINRPDYNTILEAYNYMILAKLHNRDDLARKSFNAVTDDDINYICTDKSISPGVKKRLFMTLLSLDRIKDVEKWSENTSLILHYWEVRQKHDGTNYYGDYDVIFFLGKNKLRIRYIQRSDRYIFSKNDFDDPTLIFEMFTEIEEVLRIKMAEVTKKTERGDWIIKGEKVLFARDSGFNFRHDRMYTPVYVDDYMMEVTEEKTILLTTHNFKRVFTCTTGLLNHTATTTPNENFQCYNIEYHDLISQQCFTTTFDVESCTDRVIHTLLKSLEVSKPPVSQRTIDRLELPNSWNVRNIDFQDEEEVLISKTESKEMNFVEWLIEDEKEVEETLKNIDWEYSSLQDFVKEFAFGDFFNSIQLISDIQFPKKTFQRIKNLKYDCLALSVTYMGIINKSTINYLIQSIQDGRKYVLYALVSRYDRTVSDHGAVSPDKVVSTIDPYLYTIGLTYRKFKLVDVDD
jgi:hypothetical protein